ncbi:hypothetical protein GH5_01067 [Leishmania sp. Ghana 2012 LV757]|uniref:hypothetical protein n=1 Tax=Leishmania sp. Ghana 2012 LV757 TaxID=2803181 RepID=UPI001B4309C9|nr:hypothetical protein GH5_01067 [Leishmania sp. Ghana 2012 LV757]
MSSVFFCGIPHSPPNAWEVHQATPVATLQGYQSTSHFSLELHELSFYVDVYNEHHTCCWPRLVLDAHLGNSAKAVAHADTVSPASQRVERPSLGSSAVTEGTAGASSSLYIDHISDVMMQLYRAQREKVPRAAYARRALFHQGVPPVLRCHDHSNSFVYVVSGQLRLFHSCRRGTVPKCHRCVEHRRGCKHGPTADHLARDVFPLVLIMAPGDDCAEYVDAEPPVASAATQWRTKPVVLALESVEAAQALPTAEAGKTDEVWCAAYTPFTWICNPLGNQKVSVLIKSTAATRRMPRTQSHDAVKSASSKRAAMARHVHPRGDKAGDLLPPLRLSFAVYAALYTCEAAKERVVQSLVSSDVYNLHVTKGMRFGLGGADLYKRAVLGTDEEALLHARSRRPAQLMRLLDEKLECVAHGAWRASGPGKTPNTDSADGAAREAGRPAAWQLPGGEDDSKPPSTEGEAGCQVPHLVPLVTAHHIAELCTARPIEREWCLLPKSITLASVLRRPRSSASSQSGWPLRVMRHTSEGSTHAVELSSLATLQELAAALRRVSP